MNINSKLHLNTLLILLLLLLFVGISFVFFSSSRDRIERLVMLEIIEEQAFELEVNINEHARAVLHYIRFPEEVTLNKINDSQFDLELHLGDFMRSTKGLAPHLSLEKIRKIDKEHKFTGDEIVSATQSLHERLQQFRAKVRSIDKLIDEEFQNAIQFSDADIYIKLESALDIEINIHEAFAAVEGYALAFDIKFLTQIADAKSDFNSFVERYRNTNTTTEEEVMLNEIEKTFFSALEDGNRIIILTDTLNKRLLYFEQQLNQIDQILDEEIQFFFHQEHQDESKKMEDLILYTSIFFILSAVIIFLIVGGTGFLVSRGIIEGVKNLSEGLEQFGEGNLDFQIRSSSSSSNELALLADDCNRMARNLRQTTISRDALIDEVGVRKQVEKELETSRSRFAGILEIAQDAIISISESQHIIIFNEGAEATFGYTEKEVLGRPIDFLIPERFRKDHYKHVNGFAGSDLDTRQMGDGRELFGLHKNGVEFPVEATISKLLSNGVMIFTVIMRDISDRKKTEQQLQEYNISLKKAVDQKELEMQKLNGRLLRQEKLATLGKISGNIAHELRNPLGAINQSVFYLRRLVERGKVDEHIDKFASNLELINSELDSANTVITNLLDATQKKPLTRSLVDMEKLTVETVNNSTLTRTLDIKFQLEPSPFLVDVDPEQFRQIITNLLANAAQNSKDNMQVTIRARFLSDIGQALIQIEDNGPGIVEENINKVFEPLFTTREMGTGLGLSICKQIIENHHGTIVLSNGKKQGTLVEIRLPMKESDE